MGRQAQIMATLISMLDQITGVVAVPITRQLSMLKYSFRTSFSRNALHMTEEWNLQVMSKGSTLDTVMALAILAPQIL